MRKLFEIAFLSATLLLSIALSCPGTVNAWPIPDTGQTQCYNNNAEIPCPAPGDALAQDGSYTINPPSYTKLDASGSDLPNDASTWVMVRDNVTGLIWENKTSDDTIHNGGKFFNWCDTNAASNGGNQGACGTGIGEAATDTEAFIKALNDAKFGGFADWRLPSPKELVTIFDSSRNYPVVNPDWFPNTLPDTYYWSSSTSRNNSYAWGVSFGNGYVQYTAKANGHPVRAVRGGQSGSTRYVDNGDGTATDTGTGLMWRQESVSGKTWELALAYAEGLDFAGYSDWRLPTVSEQQSLVDYNLSYPAIDATAFPGTISSTYWSSSSINWGTHAYASDFNEGYLSLQNKSNGYYARTVRGGQNRASGNLVIASPTQGAHWEIGGQKTIAWETGGISDNVKITLSRQGGKTGTFTETIAGSVENSGSFNWTVTGSPSVNCALRIEPVSDASKGTTQSLFTISQIYTIAAGAGPGGAIFPSGMVNIENDTSQTFTITRNVGFNIVDVLVDGQSVGPVATYSFNTITANHTINVTFVADTPTTGTIAIEKGNPTTNHRDVVLTFNIADADKIAAYFISEQTTPPTLSASWTSITKTTGYSTSVPYTLSAGDGSKTVYAWFKDGAGNISSALSATITLDISLDAPLDVWTWAMPSTSNQTFNGIAYNGNGLYVAVGDGSTIATSSDGINWKARTYTNLNASLTGVTYGGGMFVAVGDANGVGAIFTSTDGLKWHGRYAGAGNNRLSGVAYGGNKFVAVSSSWDRVVISSDGLNWEEKSTGQWGNWSGIVYGNGKFVAVDGGSGNGNTITSVGGITWVSKSAGTNLFLRGIAYGNGKHVAVGWSSSGTGNTGAIYTFDGSAWENQTPPGLTNNLYGVAWSGTAFVAVGDSGKLLTSADGLTWASKVSGTTNSLRSTIYGNSGFVAVGAGGAIVASADGNAWTNRTNLVQGMQSIVYGNGAFVGVGFNGTNSTVYRSSDGLNWAGPSTVGTQSLTSLAYGNGIFVAVGCWSQPQVSKDAINWKQLATWQNYCFNSVTYGNEKFVAVGQNNIYTSSDGINWTNTPTGYNNANLNSIVYRNGMFVAVGAINANMTSAPLIMTSPDGMAWTTQAVTLNTSGWAELRSIAYGSGIFITTGSGPQGGLLLTSADGVNWTQKSLAANNSNQISSVAYGNGMFVAAGSNNLYVSDDGNTWKTKYIGAQFDKMQYGNGAFVGVSGSAILQTRMPLQPPANFRMTLEGATVNLSWSPNTEMGIQGYKIYWDTDGEYPYANVIDVGNVTTYSTTANLDGAYVTVTAYDESYASSKDDPATAVNENQTNGNESWFADGWIIERNAPVNPSVKIIGYTSTTNMIMTLSAQDAGGITSYYASEYATTPLRDASGWNVVGKATSLLADYPFTVGSGGDGAKTVYVWFKDGAGNISSAASATVSFDLSPASPLDVWTWAMPSTSNQTFNGIAYGNNLYVAIGDNGTIAASSDGINWTTKTYANLNAPLKGITYGNGMFVAVGDSNNFGAVFTSTDGLKWYRRYAGTTNGSGLLTGVAYGGGKFVAVSGGWDKVVVSSDGLSWEEKSTGQSPSLYGIVYGDGKFMAVGGNGSGDTLTSIDGVAWVSKSAGTNLSLRGIAYGSGKYVAVGWTGPSISGAIYTSTDGSAWTNQTPTDLTNNLYGVAWSGTTFVAVGDGGKLLTSADGTTWTSRVSGTTNSLRAAVYGNNAFVAVGAGGSIVASADGSTWAEKSIGIGSSVMRGTAYDNNTFVTVADNGKIMTSPDGLRWTAQEMGSYWFYGVAYGNNRFVAITGWQYFTSADGFNWKMGNFQGLPSGLDGGGITFGGGKFVAVGQNGTIVTSPDGTQWAVQPSGTTTRLISASYGNGKYVVIGQGGKILTSPEGASWTAQTSGTTKDLNGVTYGNGRFVAAGSEGVILSSADGILWTPEASGTNNNLFAVTYGNGFFLAAGGGTAFLVSLDGVKWTAKTFGSNYYYYEIRNIAYGKGTFLLAGGYNQASWNGFILQTRMPLQPPSNFRATLEGATVNLSWSPNTETGIKGYKIYWDTDGEHPYANAIDVGNVTTYSTTTNLDGAYVTVTAYDESYASSKDDPATAVNENQTNGNESWFADGYMIERDAPANPSVKINNSSAYTNDPSVTLTLSALDAGGIDSYYVSENAAAPSRDALGWIAVSKSTSLTADYPFTLSSSDGTKTVYVWFKDGVGNISPAASASIILDRARTVGSVTINGGNAKTSKREVTLSLSVTDNNGINAYYLSESQTPPTLSSSWTNITPTLNFSSDLPYTLSAGDGDKTVYVWFRDMAENISSVASATIVLDISLAAPLDVWTWAMPSTSTQIFNGIAYGNNLYVAVGDNSTIATSTDGINWTTKTYSNLNTNLKGVTYGNGMFVAVGDSNNFGAVFTSADGLKWKGRYAGTTNGNGLLTGVAYSGGKFVAVSTWWDKVAISADGLSWEEKSTGQWSYLSGIVYGSDKFVAFGGNGGGNGDTLTSIDGVTWVSKSVGTNLSLRGIAYGSGKYVAVGWTGASISGVIYTSTDGSAWTKAPTDLTNSLYGVAWSGTAFVAVGDSGKLLTSADGLTWASKVSGTTNSLRSTIYGNSGFVAVGAGGAIVASADGNAWTNRTNLVQGMQSIVYGNGAFVGVGFNGTNSTVYRSSDGLNWAGPSTVGTQSLTSLAYGNGIFVAVGCWSQPQVSKDAINWKQLATWQNYCFNSVTYGNEKFVAVGQNNIYTSSDGINWTNTPTGYNNANLNSIVYRNGMFVAVGAINANMTSAPLIMTSPDGMAWTTQAVTLNTSGWAELRSIAYGSGIFITTGSGPQGGLLLTSADGVNWTQKSLAANNSNQISSVAYGNGMFVAAGSNNLYVSDDGNTWKTKYIGAQFDKMQYGNGAFVGVSGSAILQTRMPLQPPANFRMTLEGATVNLSWSPNTEMGIQGYKIYWDTDGEYPYANVIDVGNVTTYSTTANLDGAYVTVTAYDESYASSKDDPATAVNENQTNGNESWFADGWIIERNAPVNPSVKIIGYTSTTNMIMTLSAQDAGGITSYYASEYATTPLRDASGWNVVGKATSLLADYPFTVGSGGDGAKTVYVWFKDGAGNISSAASATVSFDLSPASPLDVWTWAMPSTSNQTFNGIAYGNNLYVAIGDNGTIAASSDGINWTTKTYANLNAPLKGITYGNGMFVAVGDSNNFGAVFTSTDGLKWYRRYAGTTNGSGLLTGVAYGGGKFVAVSGGWDKVVVSSDGLSWEEKSTGQSPSLYGIVYGDGKFMAVGGNGSGDTLTSIDGVTWVSKSAGTNLSLRGIAYGSGKYVAVGSTGPSISGAIYTSTDGSAWTNQTPTDLTNNLNAVAWSGTAFVAVGDNGKLLTSADGITWSNKNSGATNNMKAITYGNALYVTAGAGGSIVTSADGNAWINRTNLVQGMQSIVYGNGTFVGIGSNGANSTVYTSFDGLNWAGKSSVGTQSLTSLAYGNGIFVAGGCWSQPQVSKDAINWKQSATFQNYCFNSITYGNEKFVAAGQNNIYTSSDGIVWTNQATGLSNGNLISVTSGKGMFVAVGAINANMTSAPLIMTSPDGISWTTQTVTLNTSGWAELRSIAYGSGIFITTGSGPQGGLLLTSADGINWTQKSLAANNPNQFSSVAYGNGMFVAAGSNNLYVSADGNTWKTKYIGAQFDKMQYGNGAFVGASGSTLLQSRLPIQSPANFRMTLEGATVNLSWSPNTETGIKGYKVYWDADGEYPYANVIDVGNVTTYSTTTIPDGASLTITAYNEGYSAVNENQTNGNESWFAEVWVIERNAPVNPSVRIESGAYTNNPAVTLTLSALDVAGGIASYYVSENATAPLRDALGWIAVSKSTNLTADYPYTLSNGDGAKTIYVWFKDGAGNISQAASASITLDRVGTTGSVSINNGSSKTSKREVTLSLSATDNNGIDAYYLSESQTLPIPASPWTAIAAATSNYSDLIPYTLNAGDGNKTIYVWFRDVAGNISSVASATIVLDISLAAPLDVWTWAMPSTSNQPFNGIAYGSNLYVAVGDSGTIATSTDGINWKTETHSNLNTNLKGVTYGNGMFVAVGDSNNFGAVFTSTDGLKWHGRYAGTMNGNGLLTGVAYGGGKFVAVSTWWDKVAISADGLSWEEKSTGQWSYLSGIVYGGDKFVAVGGNGGGSGDTLTSIDGVTWVSKSVGTNLSLRGIAYGSGKYVAVGWTGASISGAIYTSTDGSAWTKTPTDLTNSLYGVAWSGTAFVTVGDSGKLLMSGDGMTWTSKVSGTTNSLRATIYGNKGLVAVGSNGTIIASADGNAWTNGSTTTQNINALTYGNGMFVGIAGATNKTIITSPDGFTWTSQNSNISNNLSSIAYGNGIIVAGGCWSQPQVSKDAINWKQSATWENYCFNSITYGNEKFVAVGQNNIYTSSDGINWTNTPTGYNNGNLNSIVYGNGMFVAAGAINAYMTSVPFIMTSPDGMAWTTQTVTLNTSGWAELRSIAYGSGMFITTGSGPQGGLLLTSADGINWTQKSLATNNSNQFSSVAYGNGMFVAAGGSNIYVSADGNTWKTKYIGAQFDKIQYGNGTFVGATGSAILQTRLPLQPPANVITKISGNTVNLSWLANEEPNVVGYKVYYGTEAEPPYSHVADVGNNTSHTINDLPAGARIAVTAYDADAKGTNDIFEGHESWYAPAEGLTRIYIEARPLPLSNYSQYELSLIGKYNGGLYDLGGTWTSSDPTIATIPTGGNILTAVKSGWVEVSTTYEGVTYKEPILVYKTTTNTEGNSVTNNDKIGAKLMTSGEFYKGSLPEGDVDWFKFNLTTPSVIDLAYLSELDATMGIYRAPDSGANTIILNSANGTTWQPHSSGTTSIFNSLTFGNGIYVAAGNGGAIASSPDGANWTLGSSGVATALNAVAFGNETGKEIFVTVGAGGVILTSANGTAWEKRTSGTTENLSGIAFGNNTFIATYASGANVLTSPDGITWTPMAIPPMGQLVAVAFSSHINPGRFVVSGTTGIAASNDNGVNWMTYALPSSPPTFVTFIPKGITAGIDTFVAVGAGAIWTSFDGGGWSLRYESPLLNLKGVAYGPGGFAAVGESGTIATSPDGNTWTVNKSTATNTLNAVASGSSGFVACGGMPSDTLMASGSSANGGALNLSIGLAPGTYHMKLTPIVADSTKSYVITYKTIRDLPGKAPVSLVMDETKASVINNLDDLSEFNFLLYGRKTIRLLFTPQSWTARYHLAFLDWNGAILNQIDCLNQSQVSLEGNLPAGNYTFRVTPVNDVDADTPFTVQLSESPNQMEAEPNNTSGESTVFDISRPVTGQLVQNDDRDFYEFTLDTPRYLAFTFTAPESNGSFHINLYKDSEDSEIDSFVAIGNQTTTVHMGLSVGRYYLKVGAEGGTADTSHFYTLAFTPSDQTNLEIESNNTLKFANVIENNKTKKGRIYSDKDYDIYSFHLSEAADVNIYLKPSSSNSEYNICVVDETFIDDTETPCESRAVRNGQEMTFTFYPETAGNYYIRIWGIGGRIDPSKTYELKISSETEITVLKQKVSLALSGAQKEMTIGGSQLLKALMAWSDATTEEITPRWTSLDSSVASVDASGVVTAIKEGNTSIVANLGGFTGRFDIIVGTPVNVIKQHYGNLILVGGGGYAVTNTLRDTTLYLSDLVYRRFKERLFTDEDIYYFHPWGAHDLNGDGYPENIVRDTIPTVPKLGAAIKEWAVQQNTDGPLYIYLIDHGGMDYFTLFEDGNQVKENLTSSQLKEFIDAFQAATPRKVVVIIEACRSGSFIDDLVSPGQSRIAITSTNDQYLLLSRLGTDSFTQLFMDKLWEGNSLNTAFNNARQKLSSMGAPYNQQIPQLKDGSSLASNKLGGDFGVAGAMPSFLEKSADVNIDASIPSNTTQDLFARFNATEIGDIEKVWGVVVPPAYETSGTEIQTIKFDSVDLADSERNGRYMGSYDKFMQNGEYRIIFYAKSTNGNIIMSSPTIFTVTGGTETPKTLTVTKSGTGTGTVTSQPSGINCGPDCTETYSAQTSVTLTATADSGSFFNGWSGDGCSGTGACTVNVNAPIQVITEFVHDNRGDLNGDGTTNLADAILAIKVLSAAILPADAIRTDYATSGADVNGDGKIGPAEAVYILQKAAGLR